MGTVANLGPPLTAGRRRSTTRSRCRRSSFRNRASTTTFANNKATVNSTPVVNHTEKVIFRSSSHIIAQPVKTLLTTARPFDTIRPSTTRF